LLGSKTATTAGRGHYSKTNGGYSGKSRVSEGEKEKKGPQTAETRGEDCWHKQNHSKLWGDRIREMGSSGNLKKGGQGEKGKGKRESCDRGF